MPDPNYLQDVGVAGAASGFNPLVMAGTLGLDFLSGLLGEDPSEAARAGIQEKYKWTSPGANQMWSTILPQIQRMMMGGEAPDIGLLNKYLGLARSGLAGQHQRALGEATSMGMTQGSQMNLSNPFAYANFMGRRATTGFAPQFQQLEAQGAAQKFGAQRSMLNQLLGLAPGLIEMGAGSGWTQGIA